MYCSVGHLCRVVPEIADLQAHSVVSYRYFWPTTQYISASNYWTNTGYNLYWHVYSVILYKNGMESKGG